MTLNQSQQHAVELDAPQIVVMSGPGSGKTRVAVQRVSRLRGRIVVLTFTNAAAHEFRSRVKDAFTEHVSIHDLRVVQRAFCGTLHSYCFKLIRDFGELIGYTASNVALLPSEDSAATFKEIRDRLGYKPNDEANEGKVRDEYYFTLKHNNLVDYDRILVDGLELLAKDEVRKAVACDDLIVEEAQDSAIIDWQIYEAIPATNRFYIGDVDQAIFEFRKAYPKQLLHLAREPQSTVLKLEQNYRCAKAICEAANRLIKHNQSRYEKDTVSATGEEGQILVETYGDPWEELTDLTRKALAFVFMHRTVAVLCRTNYEVERVRDFMQANGVTALYLPDKRNPKPPDWRRALLFIGFAAAPYNEILAEQILRLDFAPEAVARWKLQGKATGTYLFDRVPVISGVPILKWLAMNGVSQSTISMIEARMKLLSESASLPDLLQDLHSNERPSDGQPEGTVYVGTIHSAKGREFDVVFLPAFEETKMNDENIEEERRLAFVAVTRARSVACISHAERRKARWGELEECRPSRFIGEMGL